MTRRVVLVAGATAPLAVRRARAMPRPIRVASKPDTEGALLGHLMLRSLAARGLAVEDRVGLGPTRIVRGALLSGQVDLYPEYVGNGAFFFQREADPAWRDAAAGAALVRSLDAGNGVSWLSPAPANNAWAIAVNGAMAEAARLTTMEDFAAHVRAGRPMRLAASAEFVESPAALPSFEAAYGFSLRRGQVLMLVGGNTAVTERAAADGTGGVVAGMAYGTDGGLAALGLRVMADTKGAQLLFAPAPVIRTEVLTGEPRIAPWLEPVFSRLDAATLRRLNARIAVDGEAADRVAADWMREIGLPA